MNRLFTAFAWVLTLTSSPLSAHDVCLVNDSDQTALFTVVSGTQRIEKKLDPKTHELITLTEALHDRVVIVQTINDAAPSKTPSKLKVVGTKVLTEQESGRCNFCYVRKNAEHNLEMEFLDFVCLDVVPHSYDPKTLERLPELNSDLPKSSELTMPQAPESPVQLRKAIWFAAEPSE